MNKKWQWKEKKNHAPPQDSVKVYERNFYSHVFDSKSSQIYIYATLSQPEVNKQTIKGCLENEDPPKFWIIENRVVSYTPLVSRSSY